MSTLNFDVEYQTFYKANADFYKFLKEFPNATQDQIDNGYKMLAIMMINHNGEWTKHQVFEAEILMKMAFKKVSGIAFDDIFDHEKLDSNGNEKSDNL